MKNSTSMTNTNRYPVLPPRTATVYASVGTTTTTSTTTAQPSRGDPIPIDDCFKCTNVVMIEDNTFISPFENPAFWGVESESVSPAPSSPQSDQHNKEPGQIVREEMTTSSKTTLDAKGHIVRGDSNQTGAGDTIEESVRKRAKITIHGIQQRCRSVPVGDTHKRHCDQKRSRQRKIDCTESERDTSTTEDTCSESASNSPQSRSPSNTGTDMHSEKEHVTETEHTNSVGSNPGTSGLSQSMDAMSLGELPTSNHSKKTIVLPINPDQCGTQTHSNNISVPIQTPQRVVLPIVYPTQTIAHKEEPQICMSEDPEKEIGPPRLAIKKPPNVEQSMPSTRGREQTEENVEQEKTNTPGQSMQMVVTVGTGTSETNQMEVIKAPLASDQFIDWLPERCSPGDALKILDDRLNRLGRPAHNLNITITSNPDFLRGLYGLQDIERLLTDVIYRPTIIKNEFKHTFGKLPNPLHFALIGKPGTGKRTALLRYCSELGIEMLTVTPELYFNGTIDIAFRFATYYRPCIVYFDMFDVLWENRTFKEEFYINVFSSQALMTKWSEVWLGFGIENLMRRQPFFDAILKLCYTRVMSVNPLSGEQAAALLLDGFMKNCGNYTLRKLSEEQWSKLCDATIGATPEDLCNFASSVIMRAMARYPLKSLIDKTRTDIRGVSTKQADRWVGTPIITNHVRQQQDEGRENQGEEEEEKYIDWGIDAEPMYLRVDPMDNYESSIVRFIIPRRIIE